MFWKLTADLTPNVKFMHTYHDDIWVIPATPSVTRPFSTIATFSGKNPSVTFGRITARAELRDLLRGGGLGLLLAA